MRSRLAFVFAALLALAAIARTSDSAPMWSLSANVPSPAGPGSGEPHLAVDPEGEVWLSWFERRGTAEDAGHALMVTRLEGNRWSNAHTIAAGDSFFVNWADFPTVLPLGGDALVAHWPKMSGGASPYAYDVWLSRSNDGGKTWSTPQRPHTDGTATEHGFVSMVADADGARLVWLDGRKFAEVAGEEQGGHDEHGMKGEMTLRSALLRRDGSLAEEAELDARVCDCCQTAAVRTARGVLVAYRDRSDREIRDISLARYEAGRWSEPYALHADGWEIPGCPVNGPALDANGERVAAAWYTGAGQDERVHVAFSDDGGRTFGSAMQVDEGSPAGRVDVALLEDGSALVLWLEQQGKGARIRVRWVDRDGNAHRAWTLARTRSARSSGFPRMVRSGERLVFAWTEVGDKPRIRTAVARLRALSGKR